MTIHKEGFRTIPITLIILLGILAICYFLLDPSNWLMCSLAIVAGVFFLLVVSFFRSPRRLANAGTNEILCPADGTVVVVERVLEKEYFKEERIQVSIFMSPLNVHVNWYPISGSISYCKYHKGKFLVAWHPKSSELNERSTVVVKSEDNGEVLIRQIAGAVARRIRTYSRIRENARIGSELGFIKFGSRVDILLPVDVQMNVKPGQKVKGISTVLGTFAPSK